LEFVAFGVTAEIIVIVENEDAALAAGVRAIVVRGGESLMPPPTTIRSLFFAVSQGGGQVLPVAAGMSVLEEPGWLPRMPVSRAGSNQGVLGGGRQGCGPWVGLHPRTAVWIRRGGADGDAVQKVAAGDG